MQNVTSTGSSISDLLVQQEEEKKRRTYPKRVEDIDVTNYRDLVLRVLTFCSNKYGEWVYNYKDDLIQAGYVGLINAREKYQKGRGSFVALAWLKILREMNIIIVKEAKYFTKFKSLESISYYNGEISFGYDEILEGDPILNYNMLFKFVRKELQVHLKSLITNGNDRGRLRKYMDDLKEELRDVVLTVYPRN